MYLKVKTFDMVIRLDQIINADINDLKNLYVATPSERTNSFARISKH
jgi:hypothetical protein